MSDEPTQFKNETISLLTEGLSKPRRFKIPFSSWSNGGVECLGKELLRAARAVLLELQIRQQDWPQLWPLLQSVLNNSESPKRKEVPPGRDFTGCAAPTPISTFLCSPDCVTITLADA